MILRENTGENINTPAQVAALLHDLIDVEQEIDRDKEHFWTIGLDVRNTVKFIDLVSLGILTSSVIHARETFRLAIMKAVNSIIIAHNHPSGCLEPSREDIAVTTKLKDAGAILGIAVRDHVIIDNNGGFVSLAMRGDW